jgi:branched-chain amino acid transport system ATP-binding protein
MLLNLDGLSTFYGNFPSLKGVSLNVQEREIVTLLGANGAGKTTLLKTISGLLKCSSGSISFASQRIDHLRPNAIVQLGISQCPEGRKLFPEMTVLKNLRLGAFVRRHDKKGIEDSLTEIFHLFPILSERVKQLAGTLSGGEQQMLAMGRALMANPTLLLLDEPSLGLAPLVVRALFQTIRDINQRGTTIFLVEQNASQALHVAHRGYVMETGQIVLSDSSANLLNNEKVRQAYLGA